MKSSSVSGTDTSYPVTTQATTDILRDVLSVYRRDSDILLPPPIYFNRLLQIDDVHIMAKLLFAWLGIKHASFDVVVDSSVHAAVSHYDDTKKSYTLRLGLQSLQDAPTTAAILARHVTKYVILTRHADTKITQMMSDEVLTFATVEIGFGIVILNSLPKNQEAIMDVTPKEYFQYFNHFTSQHAIVDTVWKPYITPRTESFFKLGKLHNHRAYIPSVVELKKSYRLQYITRVIGIVSVVVIIFLSVILLFQPRPSSSELRDLQDRVTLLNSQYQICIRTVRNKQATLGVDDLFFNRVIEKDRSRCQSIKNQHNYYVNQHNNLLR